MNNQEGFTLISFCVYLVMFAMISCVAVVMMQRSYRMYKTRGALNACVEDVYVAQDVFMHDVQSAPILVNKWKYTTTDTVAWNTDDTFIQWSLKDGALTRSHAYKGKMQTNVAVRGLDGGEFEVQTKEAHMHMISLTMHMRSIKGDVVVQTVYGFYGLS